MASIYNPDTDNPPFDDLIRDGIVLDEKGRVPIFVPEYIEPSIKSVKYVKSGRGFYRAWISNLQKSIRRGLVDDALRSAYECCIMGGPFLTNCINRVCKVIISEDIGPANNNLVLEIARFLEQFADKPFETLAQSFFEIILKACNGFKSRITMCAFLGASIDIRFSNFDDAFCYLWVKERNLCHAMHGLMQCLALGNERCTSFLRVIPKECKPSRMNFAKYKLWNWLCDPKHKHAATVNIALYKIWYEHKGDEQFINVNHALLNILLQKEVFEWDVEQVDVEPPKIDLLKYAESLTDIWPMSAAYDKHVGRWSSAERNSKAFFRRYGAKIDKVHPHLAAIEDQLYKWKV